LRLDQLILGMYAEPRALGIYSVAVTVSELIWIVPDSLGVVLFNRLAREQHMDVARKLVARVHRILFGTMAALAIALGASSGWLIQHLYGQAFANAVVPLLWLLPGTVAMTTTKVLTKYLSANGMPGRSSLLQVGGMAVSVGWYLLLIPALGTVGAAIASLIGYVGTAFASVVLYRRGLRHDRGGLFSFSREDFEWVGHQLRSALHL
jgi:O-antigen/teichoic acid export membrane protein